MNTRSALDILREVLDRASKVEQVTVDETERLLRDRLPAVLEALRLPSGCPARRALREYEAKEIRASNNLSQAKHDLLVSLRDGGGAADLLAAVRTKIADQGYRDHGVLFELFQNADDAYEQLGDVPDEACFRVYHDDRRIRTVHWGRPINHLGSNVERGRDRGYDRDLLNMLVMNFTEKHPMHEVTGKFGLGFKCIHMLSDDVRVASGFVAVRIVGGLLPRRWQDGVSKAYNLRHDRNAATLIDVPYTTEEMMEAGKRTVGAFQDAMRWLPAFARRIRRIELVGDTGRTITCREEPLNERDGRIEVVTTQDGVKTERALRLKLGDGYSLLLRIGADGPCSFEPSLGRLWNLAPLEEHLRHSGWLLNGPFPVDPGRGRLSGSYEEQKGLFKSRGVELGDLFLALHDIVESEWDSVTRKLGLHEASPGGRRRFWSRLFDVMSGDLDHDLASCMHAPDRGYGRLLAERAVTPTGLQGYFDAIMPALSSILHNGVLIWYTAKALADHTILEATRDWPSIGKLKDHIVTADVKSRLERLGFTNLRPIELSSLLSMEMGTDKRIGKDLGEQLGAVIRVDAIETGRLHQERIEIFTVARRAMFRAQDDTWQPVSRLSSELVGRDESLLCGFAPDDYLLHEEYRGASFEFFMVARMQSGYGPAVLLLSQWVKSATDESRRRAVLRYLIEGQQRAGLARKMRDDGLPLWIHDVRARISSHPLLNGWTLEDRGLLKAALAPDEIVDLKPPIEPPNPCKILNLLYSWWQDKREVEVARYEESVYPSGFPREDLPKRLREAPIDRKAWFTMLALACFQLLGRTRDGQHRSFIEAGWDEWWDELACSNPPDEFGPWIKRLEDWCTADRFSQAYHQWERTFVDLYSIARWLDQYVKLVLDLPGIVKEYERPPLDNILRPSYSPFVQRLGLEAAPIDRSLGIGANWLIRELLRMRVYDGDGAASILAPYCWAPSQRVRKFLTTLDPRLELSADSSSSMRIYDFVGSCLDDDRVLFFGDCDLPMQIVTLKRHRELLKQWLGMAGASDGFDDEMGDDDDYT